MNCTLKHFFKTTRKFKAFSRSTNSIIYQIYIIYIYIELVKVYIKLIKEVIFINKIIKKEKVKKKALKMEFKLKDYFIVKGKGLKLAIIQYICRELIIKRNVLDYRT